jgi:mRNA-degrading endonuclease RelE of RelBE toxin-antitoxin system
MRRLAEVDRRRVLGALDRLAQTEQGDVRRLQGIEPPELRLRVGDLRVRFQFEHATHTVHVLHVFPRGRAYRD